MPFWIRVDANVSRNAKVRKFRARLADGPADSPRDIFGNVQRVSVAEAVGLLVTLWGTLAQQQPDGMVSTIADADLEDWAGWRGTPGWFAAAFREFFQDKSGQVHDWDDFAGVLLERKEADKARKQALRDAKKAATSAGSSAGHPQDGPHVVPGASSRNGNGNGNDVTATAATPRDPFALAVTPLAPESLDAYPTVRVWASTDRQAWDALREAAHVAEFFGGARGRSHIIADANAALEGMPGVPYVTGPQLFQALRQWASSADRWNRRGFAEWLRVAKEDLEAGKAPRAAGKRAARSGTDVQAAASAAGDRAYDLLAGGAL